MREREIKLVVDDPGFTLPDLDGLGGMLTAPVVTTELVADYYDTSDLRLTRAGASLRFRPPEGWTVKLPADDDGNLLTRAELQLGGEAGDPPADALDLVRAWTRDQPVAVVARLRTRRTRIDVHDDAGRKLAEVVDDRVRAYNGCSPATSFREIEVELAPDAPARVAKRIVRELRRAGAGSAEPVPKIARALGTAAARRSDVAVPRPPGRRATADKVIRAALGASVARLVRHDARVRVGDDPEDVHQARVATRRMRSDLKTFAPLMERASTDRARADLAWLGALLGPVRDVDVLRALLEARSAALPEEDRPVARQLLEALADRRASAYGELLSGMRSTRYVRLLDRLVDTASARSITRGTSKLRGSDVLPALVKHPWKRLRRAVRDAGSTPSDAELHDIRIRAKRARYATEAVTPVVGGRARQLARRLRDLQDVLGAHHDSVVARQWLHEAAATASNEEAFVAGELAMLLHQDSHDLRARWTTVWRAARDPDLRRWF